MRNKIIVTLLFVLAGSLSAQAQVTFRANAPLSVAPDESFRVEFTLGTEPDADTFQAPDFEGFDVLAGPAIAQGHSTRIDNGQMTRSVQYTITYVLLPQSVGNFTIGSASIEAGGKSYSTRPLTIEIAEQPAGSGGNTGSSGTSGGARITSGRPTQEEAQGRLAQDDLLLRLHVSKQSLYKGEALLATFKIYRRVPIVGYEDVKFPSMNGFWAQEIDVANRPWQRETLNGKVYESTVVKESLLYPQQAGTLVIEPASITAIAQVVVQGSRQDDHFFGGGPEVFNVRRKLHTPRVNIAVRELPAGAPVGFSGAVGRFAMEAALSANQLPANSAGTYTVKITGTGNLSFIQAPKLALPETFEQYNVKTTESLATTAGGVSGYRQFDYPFIARVDGQFRLDSVLFTYFNPARREYVTLASPALSLEITPDRSGSDSVMIARRLSKEEVQVLGKDIRFIRLSRAGLQPVSRPLLYSGLYWGLLAGILLLFAGAYLSLHKRIRDSRNAALIRGRRANKVAIQRFRVAKGYMERQDRHAFYEEMLRALWGYMSDKFNIPVANLTKENVREELHKRGASTADTQLFSDLITHCDEAQYSPAASAQMSDIYREGLRLISRIESIKV